VAAADDGYGLWKPGSARSGSARAHVSAVAQVAPGQKEANMSSAVVVGVDGSRPSLRALEWAAQEAALHQRPLLIVHALPRYEYDIPFYPPGRWEACEEEGKVIIAHAVAVARECYQWLQVDTLMPSAAAVTALRQASEQAHVVVVGARGRGGFRSLLLGSTSLQLAGHAVCPVVVVREGLNAPHHEIVVGVDGSQYSVAAIGYAFEEAAARQTRLRAVHAWRVPPAHAEPPAPIAPDRREAAEKERGVLLRALDGWPDKHPDVEVVHDLPVEHPARALIRASEFADLVVVGSRGRGGFHGLALGSVSHAVLHHAMCPVAIARPHS
jgi:nucleotide-binding universal stress UspA family protein